MRALSLLAGAVFLASVWFANRDVCTGCHSETFDIRVRDGDLRRARLYLPPRQETTERFPCVVLAHGYLGNLNYMELPWANDLTRLGVAALLIDRRGHGASDGSLWATPSNRQSTSDDVMAAVRYARSRRDVLDPERIGVLGHSDGATAALEAAVADWRIRATVAVSASVSPWTSLSHFAPANLLLAYGEEDRFIVGRTDRLLVAQATRGYLAAPGDYGALSDGTARRYVLVPKRGHLGAIDDTALRRMILLWFKRALEPNGEIQLGSTQRAPVITGALALLVLLAGLPRGRSSGRAEAKLLAPSRVKTGCRLLFLWCLGIGFGSLLAPTLATIVPGQEVEVLMGLLLALAILMTCGALLLGSSSNEPSVRVQLENRADSRPLVDPCRGALIALLLGGAFSVLLYHHYSTAPTAARVVIFAVVALPAFLMFGALELCLRRGMGSDSRAQAAALVVLAGLTAVGSILLFERMAKAPGCLLAATLLACAAVRWGDRPAATCVAFAALFFSWVASITCALY